MVSFLLQPARLRHLSDADKKHLTAKYNPWPLCQSNLCLVSPLLSFHLNNLASEHGKNGHFSSSTLCLQCEKKEEYIERIQTLDFDTKAAIASHIQEVFKLQSKTSPL